MTATEELRRLLDERGVKWWEASPCKTKWHSPVLGGPVAVSEWNGKMVLDAGYVNVTPEQAIAATLGAGTLTAKQVMAIAGRHQPDYCSDTHVCFDWQAIADELNATLGSCNCTNDCTNDCTNSERTGTCLPHFWTHDGTLHVELPKLPETIFVRLPAQRDHEVRSARVWLYTRDSGTCHPIVSDNLTESEGMGDAWADCSECGHLLFVLTDPNSEPPNYCPNCGRRCVG